MKNVKITKTQFLVAVAILAQVGIISCSHKTRQADVASPVPDSRAAAVAGAQKYVTLEFNEGQATLTDMDKMALRNLTSQIDQSRVDEILVLAWGDREYPANGVKASSRDVKLADQRAANIKRYIQDDLAFNADVDRHNMAERPGTLARMFHTQDYRVKNTMESSGELPMTTAANEPVIMDKKASSALVLIKYQ